MGRWLKTIGALIILGVLVYVFRGPLLNRLAILEAMFAPCKRPIAYSLGAFDTRFGISKQAFLNALTEAEAVWEKPIGKELFTYAAGGNLKVNLVYDYRQQATDKLQSLGISVKDDRASYDALKTRHDALVKEYEEAKASFDARLAAFETKKSAYDKEVAYWNARRGAPKEEYAKLENERTALNAEAGEIQSLEASLNESIDQINALSVVLNRLASSLNITASEYNKIGASRGEEFQEGLYQSGGGEQEIDIYEFSSRAKLVRVLAHELGHALGLEHVTDPKAIMYKLNQGENEKPSSTDIALLKARCGIK